MRTQRRLSVRSAALAVTATAAATSLLTGCGSDSTSSEGGGSSPSASASHNAAAHNAADVQFASMMIPHHRQAVEMSKLARERAGSEKVKELAQQIKKAQAPEIDKLSGWLRSWGEKVPAPRESGEGGGSQGGGGHAGMSGMMSAEQMKRLRNSAGKEFDTAFLTLMIEHHRGAVKMAKMERKNGEYEPARKLAKAIIDTQTAEIDKMRKMLG